MSATDFDIVDDKMKAATDLADAAYEYGPVPCTNDPDAWFPEKPGERVPNRVVHKETSVLAKEMCLTSCPIVLHCRAYALKHREIDGIWGGLTFQERKEVWSNMNTSTIQSRRGISNRKH